MTGIRPEIFFLSGRFPRYVVIDGPWHRRLTGYWNGKTFVRDLRNALLYEQWIDAQNDLEKAWASSTRQSLLQVSRRPRYRPMGGRRCLHHGHYELQLHYNLNFGVRKRVERCFAENREPGFVKDP